MLHEARRIKDQAIERLLHDLQVAQCVCVRARAKREGRLHATTNLGKRRHAHACGHAMICIAMPACKLCMTYMATTNLGARRLRRARPRSLYPIPSLLYTRGHSILGLRTCARRLSRSFPACTHACMHACMHARTHARTHARHWREPCWHQRTPDESRALAPTDATCRSRTRAMPRRRLLVPRATSTSCTGSSTVSRYAS